MLLVQKKRLPYPSYAFSECNTISHFAGHGEKSVVGNIEEDT